MKVPVIRLTKNLRKSLLQGDPWLYKQAVQIPNQLNETRLCKVHDSKNEFVGWGFYSPNSPLAVRMLSLESKPPDFAFFEEALARAFRLRQGFLSEETNAFRLVNGEGDFLPGLICDIYKDTAVLQFDGEGPYQFWDKAGLAQWILKNTTCSRVYHKARHDLNALVETWGEKGEGKEILIRENGLSFYVDIVNGQKTGFFLDQRDNREYVRHISKDKKVINLFSYSGGFSVYAGSGGAKHVKSVDIAQGALDFAQRNWQLNRLSEEKHSTSCVDVFEFIHKETEKYDLVICDPPSLAKSERNKEVAIQKYVETFASAARRVHSGGHLVLSSCSSHISFDDFNDIISASLSKARKRGQILRVSGQGPDHPYPHACSHLRYLKFVDMIVF